MGLRFGRVPRKEGQRQGKHVWMRCRVGGAPPPPQVLKRTEASTEVAGIQLSTVCLGMYKEAFIHWLQARRHLVRTCVRPAVVYSELLTCRVSQGGFQRMGCGSQLMSHTKGGNRDPFWFKPVLACLEGWWARPTWESKLQG